MPNSASAGKSLRKSLVRRERNRQQRGTLWTRIKKFRAFLAEKPTQEAADTEFRGIVKALDQAVARKLIHKNAASRSKSRLAALMRNTLSLQKQLASVVEGQSNLVDVETPKGKIVVLSERLNLRVRPMLEYMDRQLNDEEATDGQSSDWTDEKNARRIELIDKKFDHRLTAAEKRELQALQQEGEQFADGLNKSRNAMMELLLLGLQQRAIQKTTDR